MVYWVVAKLATRPNGDRVENAAVERLGPFESRSAASKAQKTALIRYRNRPGASVEIKCDFS